jgi:hypothetical protein
VVGKEASQDGSGSRCFFPDQDAARTVGISRRDACAWTAEELRGLTGGRCVWWQTVAGRKKIVEPKRVSRKKGTSSACSAT